MKDYFDSFKKIIQSSDELSSNKYLLIQSSEMKESALELKQSIQPCLEVLKLSSNKMQTLITNALEKLKQTESKIDNKLTLEEYKNKIWEHTGCITGCVINIKNNNKQYKQEAIKQTEKLIDKLIEDIRQKYFVDSNKNQQIQGIGWGDKDNFIQNILNDLKYFSEKFKALYIESLLLIYGNQYLMVLQNFKLSIIDNYTQTEVKDKLSTIINNEIERVLKKQISTKYIDKPINFNIEYSIYNKYKIYIDRRSDIFWKDIENSKEDIILDCKNIIDLVFDAQIKNVLNILEVSLYYCNFLINKKIVQITSEQKVAEKAWIARQRKVLLSIQEQLAEINNY